MAARKGDWIQTFTGRAFYVLDPRPEDVDIEDIAHALSMQCRFAGHCREFYSVAQHSVTASWLVPPEDALWGLLHDAAEAYVVDLPRPIKRAWQLESYGIIDRDVALPPGEQVGWQPQAHVEVDWLRVVGGQRVCRDHSEGKA